MPSEEWGDQGRWPPKGIRFKTNQKSELVHGTEIDIDLKVKLEKLSMGELRSFAKENNLKAKDTDKSELIEEILKEMEDK